MLPLELIWVDLEEGAFVTAFPPVLRVSGRATIRKSVSANNNTSVSAAGIAYILSSRPHCLKAGGGGLDAKYAPMGGPIQKQMAKAIPTWASALDLAA